MFRYFVFRVDPYISSFFSFTIAVSASLTKAVSAVIAKKENLSNVFNSLDLMLKTIQILLNSSTFLNRTKIICSING